MTLARMGFFVVVLTLVMALAASPAHADNHLGAAPVGTAEPVGQSSDQQQQSAAAPYDFKNEGIFGCNQVAGATASAGTMAAIGGIYVPVNDAAVTLNTGILVYKECVLRPLQNRLKESATVSLFRKQYIGIQTGRDGNKQHVVNISEETLQWTDVSYLNSLTGATAQAITPAWQREVVRWAARTYQTESRSPESALTCPYKDIDARLRNESEDSIGSILAMTNPACIPHLNALQFKELADARAAQAVENCMKQLDWGRGYYPVTDNVQDCLAQNVLTPAATVQESFQQVLNSPLDQLQSADDVGEIIGALFAGVTTQALTDTGGLAGLAQSNAGRPSYLDQVVRESSQGVIGAAVNAALSILNSARQTEAGYLSIMNAIAEILTQAIEQIRQTERACWSLVVPKAREYASANSIQLSEQKIAQATSTLAFAQQVIDRDVAPLANVALSNVQASQRAVGLIDQLIAGVTNTQSVAAQRLALQQLDNLVAQKQLHTQYDVANATQQREDIKTSMEGLVVDTAQAWGDSTDASVGWCNINNTEIPRLWAERWKK